MLRSFAALVSVAVLALAGCGDTGTADLRGSVDRVYALDFVETRAHLSASELTIEYITGDGQTAVQLIARPPPQGPGTVDLAADGDIIGERDGVNLPARKSGRLLLIDYEAGDGSAVVGTFEAVLTTGERDYTLVGAFDTVIDDVRGR